MSVFRRGLFIPFLSLLVFQESSVYRNRQYQFEVVMPKGELTEYNSSYDVPFGKINFVRVSIITKQSNGIISYKNLQRVISTKAVFKKGLDPNKAQTEFIESVLAQNAIAAEDNGLKIASESRKNYSDRIQWDWILGNDSKVEHRRIIVKFGASCTISILSAKATFDTKRKDAFFNSFKFK